MIKLHKGNECFDFSKSHEFEPSEELSKYAYEDSQTISIDEDVKDVKEIGPLTQKMRACKHNRLWRFSIGMPSNIIGCCDCDYWRFI